MIKYPQITKKYKSDEFKVDIEYKKIIGYECLLLYTFKIIEVLNIPIFFHCY